MIPATKDIIVRRGDTFSMFGRVRDKVWDSGSSSYVPGPYKDLTGWTGLSQIRQTSEAGTTLATITVTLGNQTTTPGSFFLTMTPAVTAALVMTAAGVWDLQFTTPAGEVFTYLEGSVTLSKDVSRTP